MKLFDHNAAALLFEKASSLSGRHSSWRCICLNFPDNERRYNRTLHKHFVVGAITELLSDLEGYVYICDDGDIFILFQGALRPVADRLGSHFEDLNLALAGKGAENSIFAVFDLSCPDGWHAFSRACRDKHLALCNRFRQASSLASVERQ